MSTASSSRAQVACSHCNLRELCLPVGLSAEDMARLDDAISERRPVLRGAAAFSAGDRFTALFAVRAGFFKTSITTAEGREQITGFQTTGELLGMDGIGTGAHSATASALEDSQICVIPFAELEDASRQSAELQRRVHRVMSREIVREQGVMLMLGGMRAEQRLAAFLLSLAKRLQARGFAPADMLLRMSREEIGNYLGMTIETVSRTFAKLRKDGVVAVDHREIRILRPDELQTLASGASC
ncbi:fumarate/nitrate reduction transcriptional regulator Fnr [Aquincola tertiaricarbonis]|uniref:Fumarate/nitrate reduction transcriptional regulator Fnr n=1 Tax=Aquincola tertiaricarbonis TaxID=391953 RepID=A0ABY4S3J0_AQUTE|nr:fumarate/nitrate reduction transcriptional regulator Fnr [Aquincola tertiaricarbonis]URI05930.1 fumarate/nitrate reduction transcriptional regulator Fnr [Aquincola tertiaricarbonis]